MRQDTGVSHVVGTRGLSFVQFRINEVRRDRVTKKDDVREYKVGLYV